MDLSIIVPSYNEEKSVELTINQIKEVMSSLERTNYEIITVDDGSIDKTSKILGKIKGIKVITHPYNKGYGASLKIGIKNAKYDWILISDADGTYPIKDIPKLLRYTDKYDMVVGSRSKRHIPLIRRLAKRIISSLANFLTNTKIPDLNSGFRVFKKEVALKFLHLFPSRFSFTITITLACLTSEYSIKYIPIEYFKRKGKSTIHPINDFVDFLSLIIRIITYFKPLKIFGTISFIFFTLSLFIALYSILFLNKVMDITVIILFLASVQIFLFGLIAELIVKSREK